MIYISPGKVLAAREIVEFIPEESVSTRSDEGEYEKKECCAVWGCDQFQKRLPNSPAIHVFKNDWFVLLRLNSWWQLRGA